MKVQVRQPLELRNVVHVGKPQSNVSEVGIAFAEPALRFWDIGEITAVRVVRDIPSLTEPAVRSIRQWKFRPAQLDGKPVDSKMAVAFSFVPPNVGPRI